MLDISPDKLAELAEFKPRELLEHLWPSASEPPPRNPDGSYLSGKAWRAWVRERSPHVMIGLSFGKDSLSALHSLLDTWDRDHIHGYWLWNHPALGWQRRQLAYYRRELGIPIYAVAHRSMWIMLDQQTYQPPHHVAELMRHNTAPRVFDLIYTAIAMRAGILDQQPWVAQGVRAADSPMRRIVISQRGPYNLASRVFYPIWDERKVDVRRRLLDLAVKLPCDYHIWGRSFDGLDHRFIKPLAEHFPDDYARLREMYPLMETEFVRRTEPLPDVPPLHIEEITA